MFFKKKQDISPTTSDEFLLQAYKETGNIEYIGQLFDRYTQLSFLVCMKYLKEEEESRDTVMQVFEQLIGDLKRYEVQTFRYWLHSILKNRCLAILSQKQKNNFVSTESAENFLAEQLADEDTEKEVYLSHLPKALERLNDEQKICIDFFYLQQKSYKEIADITGFDLNKVKSYIQNGKRNLKMHLMEMSKG